MNNRPNLYHRLSGQNAPITTFTSRCMIAAASFAEAASALSYFEHP